MTEPTPSAGKSTLPPIGLPVWIHVGYLAEWREKVLVLKELERCVHMGEVVVRVVREE